MLIQINQALKRDVKVELLIRDFGQLRESGKISELSQSLCFVGERIHVEPQDIVISQFFDMKSGNSKIRYTLDIFSFEKGDKLVFIVEKMKENDF